MAANLPLDESIDVVANANGVATQSIGPRRFGETWYVSSIAITSNSTSQSVLTIYRGIVSNTSIVGGSFSGNFDSASGGSDIIVEAGDHLVFQWTNASSGAECQARLEGTLYSRRLK